jgi:xyloglucan galactosyltransferase MUR3
MAKKSMAFVYFVMFMLLLFHPLSAYERYKVRLPEEHDTYSMLILENDVRAGNVSIEETLRRIPPDVAERMTQTMIKLIPRLVYAWTRGRSWRRSRMSWT